jgi:hypothetical protein
MKSGEKIDQLLKPGVTLSIALDAQASGSVFQNGSSEYAVILDANEFGLLLAPIISYLDEESRHMAERQGIPTFVRWERIIAVRAHPSAANS